MSEHSQVGICLSCSEKLTQTHEYLKNWFLDLKSQYPMVHISWSYRDEATQNRLFEEKKTKAMYPYSLHNFTVDDKPCAKAIDLFVLSEEGEARFPWAFYKMVADQVKAKSIPIRWGGNFKSIKDGPHFELT